MSRKRSRGRASRQQANDKPLWNEATPEGKLERYLRDRILRPRGHPAWVKIRRKYEDGRIVVWSVDTAKGLSWGIGAAGADDLPRWKEHLKTLDEAKAWGWGNTQLLSTGGREGICLDYKRLIEIVDSLRSAFSWKYDGLRLDGSQQGTAADSVLRAIGSWERDQGQGLQEPSSRTVDLLRQAASRAGREYHQYLEKGEGVHDDLIEAQQELVQYFAGEEEAEMDAFRREIGPLRSE